MVAALSLLTPFDKSVNKSTVVIAAAIGKRNVVAKDFGQPTLQDDGGCIGEAPF
jgi:hypothetical protein